MPSILHKPNNSQINLGPFTVNVDIIPIYKKPLVCQLERNLATAETVVVISPVTHFHTKPSVLLRRLGVKWWSYWLYSLLLQKKFICNRNYASHYGDWRLLEWWCCKTVLMLLFHLLSQFLDPTVLYPLTRLEQVSGHYFKFSSFILFVIFLFILIEVPLVWD